MALLRVSTAPVTLPGERDEEDKGQGRLPLPLLEGGWLCGLGNTWRGCGFRSSRPQIKLLLALLMDPRAQSTAGLLLAVLEDRLSCRFPCGLHRSLGADGGSDLQDGGESSPDAKGILSTSQTFRSQDTRMLSVWSTAGLNG